MPVFSYAQSGVAQTARPSEFDVTQVLTNLTDHDDNDNSHDDNNHDDNDVVDD